MITTSFKSTEIKPSANSVMIDQTTNQDYLNKKKQNIISFFVGERGKPVYLKALDSEQSAHRTNWLNPYLWKKNPAPCSVQRVFEYVVHFYRKFYTKDRPVNSIIEHCFFSKATWMRTMLLCHSSNYYCHQCDTMKWNAITNILK